MKYSDAALKTLILKEKDKITNARYSKECCTTSMLDNLIPEERSQLEFVYKDLLANINADGVDGFICPFDEEFPRIPGTAKASEKPCLLFYKGDINLVRNINLNVAVIGVLTPDSEVQEREEVFVKELVNRNSIIVSGLAKGCDSISHLTCLKNHGKTVAILPNQIGKIYPKENTGLAEDVVRNEGLLITEYYKAPSSKYESTGRFIERDRLQAMFSASIILTASYRKGEGDSGSRYAMDAALKYGTKRYVMFNKEKDTFNPMFGLNKDFLESCHDIKVLSQSTLDEIINRQSDIPEQIYEQIQLKME